MSNKKKREREAAELAAMSEEYGVELDPLGDTLALCRRAFRGESSGDSSTDFDHPKLPLRLGYSYRLEVCDPFSDGGVKVIEVNKYSGHRGDLLCGQEDGNPVAVRVVPRRVNEIVQTGQPTGTASKQEAP